LTFPVTFSPKQSPFVKNWKIYMLSSIGGYFGGKLGSIIFSTPGGGLVGGALGGVFGGGVGKMLYRRKK